MRLGLEDDLSALRISLCMRAGMQRPCPDTVALNIDLEQGSSSRGAR